MNKKVWNESDVTIPKLTAHMSTAGLPFVEAKLDYILIRNLIGIAFKVWLDADRNFVILRSTLPVTPTITQEQRYNTVQKFNTELFLPSFHFHEDGSLVVQYSLSYSDGMITNQFMMIIHRFASLLQFMVEEYDTDDLFDFSGCDNAESEQSADEVHPSSESEVLH